MRILWKNTLKSTFGSFNNHKDPCVYLSSHLRCVAIEIIVTMCNNISVLVTVEPRLRTSTVLDNQSFHKLSQTNQKFNINIVLLRKTTVKEGLRYVKTKKKFDHACLTAAFDLFIPKFRILLRIMAVTLASYYWSYHSLNFWMFEDIDMSVSWWHYSLVWVRWTEK